tara:strand:+ start:1916 stop:2146 length:231 start_codon:yes stop_codon:yes gene_type:complete
MEKSMSDDERPDYLRLIKKEEEDIIEADVTERRRTFREWMEWRGLEKGSVITGIICLSVIILSLCFMITGAIISLL